MQLKDKSGVACDCCGQPQQHDFVYYSLDLHYVEVAGHRFPPGWLDAVDSPPVFSIDACPACMKIIEGAVKVNFKPMREGVGCELCPAIMKGPDFNFYLCKVTKVSVSLTRGRQRCVCGFDVPNGQTQPCKRCGRQQLVKSAEVSTDDKYLQIMVCPVDYSKLTDNAARLRVVASARK